MKKRIGVLIGGAVLATSSLFVVPTAHATEDCSSSHTQGCNTVNTDCILNGQGVPLSNGDPPPGGCFHLG
jgi:hypothetical protein